MCTILHVPVIFMTMMLPWQWRDTLSSLVPVTLIFHTWHLVFRALWHKWCVNFWGPFHWYGLTGIRGEMSNQSHSFYPRPVLAFGYCHCLRLCVPVCPCVCVCQSLVCPSDNSGPVQVRITKFGPKVQNNLLMVADVLWCDLSWPSR